MKTFKPTEAHKNSNISWQVTDEDLNKSETLTFKHSQHSLERANQRSIDDISIANTIEYGKAFFKQGLIFYALGEHNIPKNNRNKLSKVNTNLIVVVAGNSNTIITCYRSKNPFKHLKKKQKNLAPEFYSAA